MTYGYDNYTNTGVIGTLQYNKNWTFQVGVTEGTDSIPFNDQLKDPGLQPSLTACGRWQSDTAYDSIYSCANGINNGTYGYNNLQQYTTTYYHKFNDQWHLSLEGWFMHENNSPAALDASGNPTNGATIDHINPAFFSSSNSTFYQELFGPHPFANGPWAVKCKQGQIDCESKEFSLLAYLNYQFSPLDNLSLRGESFHDINGSRTGVATVYNNWAVGWQHWFSPTVTFRPEIAFYNSGEAAFGRNNANGDPTQSHIAIFSADVIWHF